MNNSGCKSIFAKLFAPEQYCERLREAAIVVCLSEKTFAIIRFRETLEFFVLLIINDAFVTKGGILNFHYISIIFVAFEIQSFYPKEKDGSKVVNGYIRDIFKGVGAAVLG
jgi:hypothetical protein